MALRCGIVGLPNVGKSTLFNALTRSEIAADNYPFCTIEPHSGIVAVPDPRLPAIHAIAGSKRAVAATVEFVDIAGLVRGASRGEGLGNQFLGHIRETDAIAHVVRCFEDPDVAHIEGGPDPTRDVETVETELILADLETAERRLDRARRAAKAGDQQRRAEVDFFEAVFEHLDAGRPARDLTVPEPQQKAFQESFFLTAKPALYVANVDESAVAEGDPHCVALAHEAQRRGAGCLRICAQVEAELGELEPEERQAFLEALGFAEPGLNRLIREVYALLDLISFFTANDNETHAWTVRRGTLAPSAAGAVHSDFETGFVRAEVIPFADYERVGGESHAKAQGLMRIEGKDYEVRDGDVIYFRNAP